MARDVSTSLADRFVEAGLEVLRDEGPAQLTVRRVAERAGSSTMGVYTRFGGRTEMLEAIYRRGFELLRDALVAARDGRRADRILAMALAYRDFALANPALYALMFERPLPTFDPSPAARTGALGMTFELLTAELGGKVRPAYLVWATIHGIVSIELTHALRSPLPGWFVDSPRAGARVLREGLRAVRAGLALR